MNRKQLAREYNQRHKAGESYSQLLADYNASYRAGMKPYTRGFIASLLVPFRKIIHVPRSEFVKRPENMDTDSGAWQKSVKRLLSDNRFVRIMHMNDLHLPYHDENAVSLFFQLAERFQPDVVVVGSDAFDYPTISRYESDKDISVDDWLERTERYWIPIINTLRDVVPGALLPFIFGNHDRRALVEIGKLSIPRVALREYKRIIQHGGVMWLGKTEVVEIGNQVVAHGKRFNMYASAYTSKDFNFRPVNAGHTHRPQQMLSCTINGMLCQKIPAYDDNGYPSDWKHGTSLITLDTHTGKSVQVPYAFEVYRNTLWTAYAGDILTGKQSYAGSEAA